MHFPWRKPKPHCVSSVNGYWRKTSSKSPSSIFSVKTSGDSSVSLPSFSGSFSDIFTLATQSATKHKVTLHKKFHFLCVDDLEEKKFDECRLGRTDWTWVNKLRIWNFYIISSYSCLSCHLCVRQTQPLNLSSNSRDYLWLHNNADVKEFDGNTRKASDVIQVQGKIFSKEVRRKKIKRKFGIRLRTLRWWWWAVVICESWEKTELGFLSTACILIYIIWRLTNAACVHKNGSIDKKREEIFFRVKNFYAAALSHWKKH